MSRGKLFHVVSAMWLTSRVRFFAIRDGKSQPRWHPRALLLPRSTAACTGDRKHDRGRQADRPTAPGAIGRGACRVRSRPSSSAMPVASIRGAPPDGHLLRTPCQTKNWTTPVATAGANGIPRNLGLSGVDMDVDRHSRTARAAFKEQKTGARSRWNGIDKLDIAHLQGSDRTTGPPVFQHESDDVPRRIAILLREEGRTHRIVRRSRIRISRLAK